MTNTISSRKELNPQKGLALNISSSGMQSDETRDTTSKPLTENAAQSSVIGLHLVHATDGRIRIRTADGSYNSILDVLSETLRLVSGVKSVFANKQTGSLTINFDTNKLSLPQLLSLLQEFGVRNPESTPSQSETQDPFAAWKSIDFWKEQGLDLIPLFAGLGVTGALGIGGLPSIPVYMIAANATRAAIAYLRSLSSIEESNAVDNKTELGDRRETTPHSPLPTPHSPFFTIFHSTPGRIRFKIPRIASDRAYARRLERLLKSDKNVTNIRVNNDAASVTITYKYSLGAIPESHWVALLESADKETALNNQEQTSEVETVSQEAQPKSESASQLNQDVESIAQLENSTLQMTCFWAMLKPPALSFCLNNIANLRLS